MAHALNKSKNCSSQGVQEALSICAVGYVKDIFS